MNDLRQILGVLWLSRNDSVTIIKNIKHSILEDRRIGEKKLYCMKEKRVLELIQCCEVSLWLVVIC